MKLPYSNDLNIERLGRLFDNTTLSYKLFWFKAIFSKVIEGKQVISYEELVNEMIAEAWYMVTEYHLNLGSKDSLEDAVIMIQNKYPFLKSSEKKSLILKTLEDDTDKEIKEKKHTLIKYVPYRLLSPFLPDLTQKVLDGSRYNLIELINQNTNIIYNFSQFNGLSTNIILSPQWCDYIKHNEEIIKCWIEYNMIVYLQSKNPNVPGIPYKLSPPQERKLEKIRSYWKLIIRKADVYDIYGKELLVSNNLSIDHFIPWSYVANDEMWNLCPTTKSTNSSKSNKLPNWETYFEPLVTQEYLAYQLTWSDDEIHNSFNTCAEEHINSDDIKQLIYREGLQEQEFGNALESIIKPVYLSAQNCGFEEWYKKD